MKRHPIVILFLLTLQTFVTLSVQAGWEKLNSGTNRRLNCVTVHHAMSLGKLWVCGDNGLILYSSNGGSTWQQQTSGTSNNLYTITFKEVTGGPVFAAGANGIILRTTDDGTTWNQIPSGTSATLRDHSDFQWFIVGDSGVVLKSTDNGLSWARKPSGTTAQLNSVAGFNPIHAVGNDGTVIRAVNQGESWQVMSTSVTENLYAVPMFGTMNFVFGSGSLILRSSNFGTSWFSQLNGTNSAIRSAEFSVNNTSRIYAVGDNGLILKTTDAGNSWGRQQCGTTAHLRSVFFYLDDNAGFACGDNGVILRTTDGGGTMSALNDTLRDMFPLTVGNSWRYRYTTWEAFQPPDDARTDSGTAHISVISSLVSVDSVAWRLTETRDVRHCERNAIGNYTCYDRHDSISFELVEQLNARHRLYRNQRSLDIWQSVVPFSRDLIYPTGMYRYWYPDSTNSIGIEIRSAPSIPIVTYNFQLMAESGLSTTIGQSNLVGTFFSSNHLLLDRILTHVEGEYQRHPEIFILRQNYPNPFNPATNISYDLPKTSFVSLKIFNMVGQEVATLVTGVQDAGLKSVTFDASALASGVYLYRIVAGGFVQTKKMILIK